MKKKIKAWAFMASDSKNGYYFINGDGFNEQTIYLKKPPKIKNPFDYFNQGWKWKPTEIEIIIPNLKS